MPKLLVIGATGLLGRAVLEASEHWDCIGTARGPLPKSPFPLFRLDITDPAATARFVAETKPDLIVNCAGLPDVDWCETHRAEAERVHVDGTRNLVAAAASAKLIHISTTFVFSGDRGQYKESDQPRPLNVYAETKLAGERCVPADHLVIRTTFYGWSQRKPSLAQIIVDTLRSGSSFNAFPDSSFNPLYVGTLAPLLLRARNATGVLHLGGDRVSKLAFAKAVAKAFALPEGLIYPIPMAAVPTKAIRPRDSSLDCALARSLGLEGQPLAADLAAMRADEPTHRSV